MSTRKIAPSGYIAYYRISKKGGTGLGIDAQREAVARATRGIPILVEFTEEESGKKHTNRPKLAQAMAEARKLKATLVIAKLDRLARNVHFISGLLESKVDFVACDMPDANKLTIHIMASMAEHEREAISERTKAALQSVSRELEQKGFRISRKGRRFTKLGNPRWQEALDKAWEARKSPTPAGEIDAIVARFRSEGLTLRQVAERLNQLGIKTPTGAAWYASTVNTALHRLPSAA